MGSGDIGLFSRPLEELWYGNFVACSIGIVDTILPKIIKSALSLLPTVLDFSLGPNQTSFWAAYISTK